LESVVRGNGGVPATIGILGGVAKVGMSPEEIIELASTAENKSALKVSRRDLGYICGMVGFPASSLAREDVTANDNPGPGWKEDSWWHNHLWHYDSL
jgi:pseudouridine-5'-phosphate glycosidase